MLTFNHSKAIQPERVVIMGAGGFVGAATRKRLESEGMRVVALTRREVDLLHPEAAAKLAAQLRATDTLIVTSAVAPVKSVSMLLDNLRMMQAVIDAVKSKPVAHLVYVSSDAVYKDSREPITEESCAEPGSLHGAMHLTREVMLKNELPNIPQAFVRPTLIFGPGDPHNGYGPNRFLRLVEAGKDIVLFGEGEERRDHVFIEDVAEIIRRVVLHRATGIVNAVSGTLTSFKDVAEMAAARREPRVKVLSSPRSGSMPHGGYRAFDAGLLRRLFPDLRLTSLADGLARMLP